MIAESDVDARMESFINRGKAVGGQKEYAAIILESAKEYYEKSAKVLEGKCLSREEWGRTY